METRGLPNLAIIRADMFNLPFRDDVFHAVIHQGVLEHFSNTRIIEALLEQKRVCKYYVIFDVPNEKSRIVRPFLKILKYMT
jgi:ubiquinone/menaquinone biosynthesis C-methylase UbiE